jgi:hypothetical protein
MQPVVVPHRARESLRRGATASTIAKFHPAYGDRGDLRGAERRRAFALPVRDPCEPCAPVFATATLSKPDLPECPLRQSALCAARGVGLRWAQRDAAARCGERAAGAAAAITIVDAMTVANVEAVGRAKRRIANWTRRGKTGGLSGPKRRASIDAAAPRMISAQPFLA